MVRTVFYVIHCTSEENDNGVFHYSSPIKDEETARKVAVIERTKHTLGDGHVVVERHHEVYRDGSWCIEHEAGGTEHIDYF